MKYEREEGFSLIEMLVVLVVGGILIASTVSIYQQYLKIYERQQRLISVEQELSEIQLKFEQVLTRIAGRQLSYFDGGEFSIPELPAIETSEGIIRLGLVTPLRIKGNDGICVVYAKRKMDGVDIPRMELATSSQDNLEKGVVRVVAPGVTNASDLPFQAGDLMLLAGEGVAPGANSQSVARIVRLNGPGKTILIGANVKQALIEFEFNFCVGMGCGPQIPQIINTTSTRVFTSGSAFVPIGLNILYLSKDNRSLVVRNEGGILVPSSDGSGFEIRGGKETFLGESDNLKISYLLKDNSEQPTPENKTVEWINQIKAVKVELTKSLPLPFGTDVASRTLQVTFPITIRTLE